MDMKRSLSMDEGEQERDVEVVVGRTRRLYGRGLVGLVGSLCEAEE